MKFIINSLIIIFFTGTRCFSQTPIENYNQYEIRNSSCQIINAVNIELGKPLYKSEFDILRNNEQTKFPLQTQNSIQGFIGDFNLTLDKTKKQYESQEFLWKTSKEIGKYGLNVLGNYAQALPTKHLTNFIMPAIQQGFELYVDNEINQGIETHKDDIDKLIINRINLLYSNGVNVTTANDEKAFGNLFAVAHGDIPALGREQYGVFNKELTKRAYDFINKNKEDIKLLNLKIDNKYDEVKNEVSNQLVQFQKSITEDVDKRFNELGNSIATLTKNQDEIFTTLGNIQARIKVNEVKIRELEKKMIEVQSDITALKKVQDEHARLIAQNSFQIDIISGYTFQNLNTEQKLSALKKGHFDNIFKDTEKQKIINELEKIKTTETILSVSQDVINYSSTTYETLVSTGILKGKDAQNVGKALKYITGILQTGMGVAKLFSGDASGILNIIAGIGGIFGKPPEKSPELQMLEQMYEVMNQRFNRIDEHLSIIETKIDTLTSIVFNMYKSMMISFQYVGNEFERINWKLDNLQNMTRLFLYSDYKTCQKVEEVRIRNKNPLNSYSDYQVLFGIECSQCLTGLSNFTLTKDLDYFYMITNVELNKQKSIEYEVREIFNPLRDLFKSYYSNTLNQSLYALMFPMELTKNGNKSLLLIKNIDSLKELSASDVIENYYNYEMIKEFSDLFLTYSGYFEIKGDNNDFKPLKIVDYLVSNSNSYNRDFLELRLSKLLDVTQYAITQQSLLSGSLMLDPIYNSLFGFTTNSIEQELAIKIINNDKILARNFATFLVNKNIFIKDTLAVKRLFDSSITNSKSVDSLNSLITVNDISFKVNDSNKKLYIHFSKNGQNIEILCPDFSSILSNKMAYVESIYTLLETREKINSRLIDLTFPKNINSTDKTISQFKYYYQTTQR